MGSTGAVIVAVRARREREIVAHFRESGADAPDRAKPFEPHGAFATAVFNKLLKSGAIKQTNGGYWLDTAAHDIHRANRRRTIITVMSIVVVLAIGVIAWSAMQPR